MPSMRAVRVSKRGGPLEVVERPIPEPAAGEVRVKVEGVRRLPQRRDREGGHLPGTGFPASRAGRRRRRRRRQASGESPEGRARRHGWNGGLRAPAIPAGAGSSSGARRRSASRDPPHGSCAEYVCALASAPRACRRAHASSTRRRSCAPPYDLQRVAQLRRAGRPRRDPGTAPGTPRVQFAARMGFRTVAMRRRGCRRSRNGSRAAHLDSEKSDGRGAAEARRRARDRRHRDERRGDERGDGRLGLAGTVA